MVKRRVGRKEVDFITPVREPVARDISMFLYDFHRQAQRHGNDPRALVNAFLSEFDHAEVLMWMDDEVRSLLGLNPLATPFPGPGKVRVDTGSHGRWFNYRLEDLDIIEPQLCRFLELKKLPLGHSNSSKE